MRQVFHLSPCLKLALPFPRTGGFCSGQPWGWQGSRLQPRWSACAGGFVQSSDVHPGSIKIALCVPCVLRLDKHRECEVPNLLSGSAAAARGEFGDVVRPAHPWAPPSTRRRRRVCGGRLRAHEHPWGAGLPLRPGAYWATSGREAATWGTLQCPATIWEGAARWKRRPVPGTNGVWATPVRRSWGGCVCGGKQRPWEGSSPPTLYVGNSGDCGWRPGGGW